MFGSLYDSLLIIWEEVQKPVAKGSLEIGDVKELNVSLPTNGGGGMRKKGQH